MFTVPYYIPVNLITTNAIINTQIYNSILKYWNKLKLHTNNNNNTIPFFFNYSLSLTGAGVGVIANSNSNANLLGSPPPVPGVSGPASGAAGPGRNRSEPALSQPPQPVAQVWCKEGDILYFFVNSTRCTSVLLYSSSNAWEAQHSYVLHIKSVPYNFRITYFVYMLNLHHIFLFFYNTS